MKDYTKILFVLIVMTHFIGLIKVFLNYWLGKSEIYFQPIIKKYLNKSYKMYPNYNTNNTTQDYNNTT